MTSAASPPRRCSSAQPPRTVGVRQKENQSGVHFGPTEGVYVTAGNPKYQIQMSRQLEYDRGQYLMGVSSRQRTLRATRPGSGSSSVENQRIDLRASENYAIVDTLGASTYPDQPVRQPDRLLPGLIPPHQILPGTDALAARRRSRRAAAVQGRRAGPHNRPLSLRTPRAPPAEAGRGRRPRSRRGLGRAAPFASAASITPRAAGAAVSPPTPSRTSITATAIFGWRRARRR
jgi:hypothetical protein